MREGGTFADIVLREIACRAGFIALAFKKWLNEKWKKKKTECLKWLWIRRRKKEDVMCELLNEWTLFPEQERQSELVGPSHVLQDGWQAINSRYFGYFSLPFFRTHWEQQGRKIRVHFPLRTKSFCFEQAEAHFPSSKTSPEMQVKHPLVDPFTHVSHPIEHSEPWHHPVHPLERKRKSRLNGGGRGGGESEPEQIPESLKVLSVSQLSKHLPLSKTLLLSHDVQSYSVPFVQLRQSSKQSNRQFNHFGFNKFNRK